MTSKFRKRLKVKSILVFAGIVVTVIFFNISQMVKLSFEDMKDVDDLNEEFVKVSDKKIFLYAKIRTGSTFVMDFLYRHNDIYGIFEPFGHLTPREHILFNEHIFENLYSCNLNSLGQKLSEGREEWLYKHVLCRRNNQTLGCPNITLDAASSYCKQHKYIMIKTVTTKLHHFLKYIDSNLKIIYLVRDPRAVMNSRIEFNAKKKKNSKKDIISYCDGQLENYNFLRHLHTLNANALSVYFLRYEEISQNPIYYMRDMYKFLDIKPDVNVLSLAKSIHELNSVPLNQNRYIEEKYFDTERNHPAERSISWRRNLSKENVSFVENNCKEFMNLFNYTLFQNISISVMKSFSSENMELMRPILI